MRDMPSRGSRLEAVAVVDSIVDERVLAFGSLPPAGRDLDLLLRPGAAAALAAGLSAYAFRPIGRAWVRFEQCTADAVEAVSPSDWGIGPDEEGALFDEARPLPGLRNVCRPAPWHAMLILARRVLGEGRLSEGHRSRAGAIVEEDPRALEIARSRAGEWGLRRAIELLAAAYESDRPLSLHRRLTALLEQHRHAGNRVGRSLVAVVRILLPVRRPGGVVALSGLDGSGKSSQAAALAEALQRLGFKAEVAWTSVASHPAWLQALAQTVKRLLASRGRGPERARDPAAPSGSGDPAKALRQRSDVLTFAWSTVVSVRVALETAWRVWPKVLAGKIVVCDRYVLDSWVHLRYQYGEERRFRAQIGVIRLLSPRPRVTLLLDVPAEVASRRKQEYSPAQNARRARLYREAARSHDANVVDADQPLEDVCSRIADTVISALR